MGKIRRTFDTGFKMRVCEAIVNGVKSIEEISKTYQLQKLLIEGWLAKYHSGELLAKSKAMSREQELEIENEKLKAKIGELTILVDALKKAERYKLTSKKDDSYIYTPKNTGQWQMPVVPLALPAPSTTTSQKDKRR